MSESEDYNYNAMAFMRKVPRFGHTNIIASLASQDASVKKDYINGIVAFCLFLFSFFLLWSLLLAFFKKKGVQKYGCLAGQSLYRKESETRDNSFKRFSKYQYIFITGVMGVFVGCTMLTQRGIEYLAIAVPQIESLNNDMMNTIMEGRNIALDTGSGILAMKEPFALIEQETDLSSKCNDPNYFNLADLANLRNVIVESMNDIHVFVARYELEGLEQNLNIMIDRSNKLQTALTTYISHDWIVKMFSTIMAALSVYFLLFIITSWCDFLPRNRGAKIMTGYIVMPLLFILVIISWLLMITFAAGSTMNSDFCYGDGSGPVSTIEQAMLQYGIEQEHLMFQSFQYYKSDCTRENPWDIEVNKQIQSAEKALLAWRDLDLNRQTTIDNCGNNIIPFLNDADALQQSLTTFVDGLAQGLNLARCSRIQPLYRRIFNGASCEESLNGLTWSFYAVFAVALSAVVMFSSRAALFKVKTIEAFDEQYMQQIDDLELKEDYSYDYDNQNYTQTKMFNDDELAIKQKESGETTITFSTSDEEHGVEVNCRDAVDPPRESFPPSVRSNSTIDTNECFDDDGVNSYNAELEPLSPTSTQKSNKHVSPVKFRFASEKKYEKVVSSDDEK